MLLTHHSPSPKTESDDYKYVAHSDNMVFTANQPNCMMEIEVQMLTTIFEETADHQKHISKSFVYDIIMNAQ